MLGTQGRQGGAMKTTSTSVVVGIADKQPTALRFALREARRKGTGLRVVHSAGISTQANVHAATYAAAALLDELRDAGQKVLDDARHFIEQEISPVAVTYVLTTDAPIEALEG